MSRAPDADGWVALSDVEWMNIVNHDHAYADMSKDDAVHAAVKAAEAKLREINVAIVKPTLRDYFAAKAMAALICMPCNNNGEYHDDAVADTAYKMADQMLVERAK